MKFTKAKKGEVWVTYWPTEGYQLFRVERVQTLVMGFTRQKIFGFFLDCQPSKAMEECLVENTPEGCTIEADQLVYKLC